VAESGGDFGGNKKPDDPERESSGWESSAHETATTCFGVRGLKRARLGGGANAWIVSRGSYTSNPWRRATIFLAFLAAKFEHFGDFCATMALKSR